MPDLKPHRVLTPKPEASMSTSVPWRFRLPAILNYAVAVLGIAAATIVTLTLDHLWGITPSLFVFLCIIMFVAWANGSGPALLATALALLSFDYFFIDPPYTFSTEFAHIPRLAVFVAASLFVVWLIASQQRTADALRARVDELRKLNETLRLENAERRQAEERALEAEQRLQELIDTLPALIARRGADGKINFLNQPWFTYTGLSRDRPQDYEVATFHPEDELKEQQAWASHLARGEAYDTEYRLRRADGEYRWHYVRRAPFRDADGKLAGWYGVAFDSEDRKRAEDALRRSEAELTEAKRELQRTIDTIPVLVAIYQPDGMRISVNQPWRNYSGLGFQDAVGDAPMLLVHPDEFAEAERAWRAALATGAPLRAEVRVRRADGEYRWHRIERVPLRDESGDVIRWYGVAHDIDDQKRAESALHAAQTALSHASRVATLGEISASIAHEVSQPLSAIITNGEVCLRLLRRDTPDLAAVRDAVEWIVKDGSRAAQVIRRVHGLVKKSETQKAPLDINDTINEVAALLQRELAGHHVSLQRELAPAMPSAVADRVQLQQVIINLIMNGIEAMQAVTGRPRVLTIRSYQDDARRVVVAVKDSGVGIASETAGRLFEAFFTTKPSGLGMGLSICRSIIEDHGGRLWATDNSGEPGATFQFALPPYRDSV
jgi:PAS domain S-box-containing protein